MLVYSNGVSDSVALFVCPSNHFNLRSIYHSLVTRVLNSFANGETCLHVYFFCVSWLTHVLCVFLLFHMLYGTKPSILEDMAECEQAYCFLWLHPYYDMVWFNFSLFLLSLCNVLPVALLLESGFICWYSCIVCSVVWIMLVHLSRLRSKTMYFYRTMLIPT